MNEKDKTVHNSKRPPTMAQIAKERRSRDILIRMLYNNGRGLSMNAIVANYHYGKRTVWNAIHRIQRKGRKKIITHTYDNKKEGTGK